MSRDLVQKDERGDPFERFDEFGLGENEPDEEGLLLARGALRGRRLVGAMKDNKVAEMGSFKGSRGRPVALAALFETEAKFVLDFGCRARGQPRLEAPVERHRGPR